MSRRGDYEVLANFESRTTSAVYEIRRGGDDVVYCTCPAWRMKQGRSSCKHLDEYQVSIQQKRAGPRHMGSPLHINLGDIVECNSRGVIFLLKVDFIHDGATVNNVKGIQLLDPGEAQTSLRGERMVDLQDVVRIVSRARR